MPVPDTLQQKIDLFKARGEVIRRDNELFAEPGWVQVFYGQNIVPAAHHPLAELLTEEQGAEYMRNVSDVVAACVQAMPDHAAYIRQFCLASIP